MLGTNKQNKIEILNCINGPLAKCAICNKPLIIKKQWINANYWQKIYNL